MVQLHFTKVIVSLFPIACTKLFSLNDIKIKIVKYLRYKIFFYTLTQTYEENTSEVLFPVEKNQNDIKYLRYECAFKTVCCVICVQILVSLIMGRK